MCLNVLPIQMQRYHCMLEISTETKDGIRSPTIGITVSTMSTNVGEPRSSVCVSSRCSSLLSQPEAQHRGGGGGSMLLHTDSTFTVAILKVYVKCDSKANVKGSSSKGRPSPPCHIRNLHTCNWHVARVPETEKRATQG